MKLYSPDGSVEIVAHPNKVDYLIAKGWKSDKKEKKAKKEAVVPVVDAVSEELMEELHNQTKEFE